MDYYKKYLVIGGMPRVILDYLETDDFNFVLASQKTINDSYIADMAKYATPMETIKILIGEEWNGKGQDEGEGKGQAPPP